MRRIGLKKSQGLLQKRSWLFQIPERLFFGPFSEDLFTFILANWAQQVVVLYLVFQQVEGLLDFLIPLE